MKRVYLTGVFATLVACRANPEVTPPPVASVSEPAVSDAEEPEPELEPVTPEVEPEPPAPVGPAAPTMIGGAQIWRKSKSDQPPWGRVEIVSAKFGSPPNVGDTVTILPKQAGLPGVELAITRVRKHDELADEGVPPWWEPVFESVKDRAYFTLPGPQFPGDVVVVYPASPMATLLDPKLLTADDVPPGILLKGVRIAVDVDGDGRPDAIELSVCTDNAKRASCGEATATEIHRSEGGVWSLVHRFEPVS